MQYDIILITGEVYFDHPLCGIAIIKRLLEKNNYSVGLIEQPTTEKEIIALGKPKLFFGVSSGSVDSMIRNYTPLKKKREDDEFSKSYGSIPDRADLVYSNWLKKNFKDTTIVLGGTEATLRRFTHFDYWHNKLKKPILFDSKTTIIAYGSAEKQILEIAEKIKNKKSLVGIEGTCIISKEVPKNFIQLPTFEEVSESKKKFMDMQLQFSNKKNLAQKIDNRYLLQYKMPIYKPKDLDEYYELPFTRKVPLYLRGFEFSVVTHRGCIGKCNFCSLNLTQGNKIISRSEESIIREISNITKLSTFRGNIDDLGGPSANMYGMDCDLCQLDNCLNCKQLNRTNTRLINLLRELKKIKNVKNIFIRSGVRFDLCSDEYIKELKNHIYDTLKIAPEHVNKEQLKLMNKDYGNMNSFIKKFDKFIKNKKLSFYFITAHPGSTLKDARALANSLKYLENSDSVQIFTPTPMTNSTAMYYTGLDLKKNKIYIPYTYREKKDQKNIIFKSKKYNSTKNNRKDYK